MSEDTLFYLEKHVPYLDFGHPVQIWGQNVPILTIFFTKLKSGHVHSQLSSATLCNCKQFHIAGLQLKGHNISVPLNFVYLVFFGGIIRAKFSTVLSRSSAKTLAETETVAYEFQPISVCLGKTKETVKHVLRLQNP